MVDLEKMLEKADFSLESTQKNQLYYELFRKPIPAAEAQRFTMLSDAQLGFVNGGVKSLAAGEQDAKNELLARTEEQAGADSVRGLVSEDRLIASKPISKETEASDRKRR